MNIKTGAHKIRLAATLVAAVCALPLSLGIFTGFSARFSPFIMLNSVLLLKKVIWLNLVAFLILVISAVRKRFFCNYLCPAGYLCDKVSAFSPVKQPFHRKIPDLSIAAALLSITSAVAGLPLLIFFDPLSVFNGFFTVFNGIAYPRELIVFSALPLLLALNFFLPHIWCSRICPLGGLQNLAYKLRTFLIRLLRDEKKQNSGMAELNRRHFIAAGAGLATGLLVPGYLKPRPEPVIRPPGSTGPGIFNLLCIRCGNCAKSCPTGIINRNSDTGNLLLFMTPVIRFGNGYCLETCNNCGIVCPTGSISVFSISQKKNIIIGKAVIRLDDCLLLNNAECNRCKVSCSYNAVEYKYSEEQMLTIPVVKTDQCTGCGACKVVCPEGCFEIILPEKELNLI